MTPKPTEHDSAKHVQHGHDLTSGSIPRHLIRFSLPMLIGNVLQAAYSFINAIWVGKYLGTNALAAVTVSFPVIFLLIAVAAGLTLATNILIAQYVGARNWSQVKRVVQSSVVLIGGISVVLLIAGEFLVVPILHLLRTPPEVYPLAVSYMRVILFTLPCSFGFFLISSMLRGTGDSTTPLTFQAVSVLIAGLLDPVLMFGLVGMPRLGLNGTAVATIISMAAAVVALLIYLHRKCHLVAPDWLHLRMDWVTSWLTIKIGIPSAIQQSLVSLGMAIVIGLVNGFGENATAAFGAAGRIEQLALFPAMSISMAVSTLSGQNIGAQKHHRVGEILRWGVVISGGITLLVSLLAVTIPALMLKMFTNDPEVIRIGVNYLRIVGSCYVFFAIMFASNGVINGSGHTTVTTIVSLAVWIFRLAMAWVFIRILHRIEGIWYAMSISFILAMVISLGYYFSGRWKRSVVKHQPQTTSDVEGPAS